MKTGKFDGINHWLKLDELYSIASGSVKAADAILARKEGGRDDV